MAHGRDGEPGTMGGYDAACEEITRLSKQNAKLLEALKLRINCEDCHGSGTVYVQVAEDDANAEVCECDINAYFTIMAVEEENGNDQRTS